MKKIILFISFFCIVGKAYAFESGVWTDEVVNDANVVVEASEVRYRWYQNITNYSQEYFIEGENDSAYSNIDREDYITTNFSDWSDSKPTNKLNRTIEYKPANRYRVLRPIRYLFLENFSGGYTSFRIAELNVLIDNVKKVVSMTCNGCSSNFDRDISDGLYKDSAYITNGGSLQIDLGAYYGIEQIRLELFMYDKVPNTKKFDLYYNEGNSLNDRNYAYKQIASYVVSADATQPEKYLIMADASFIVNQVFSDWIYIDGAVNTTFYRQMQFLTMFRYKDIKYRYYQVDREYTDYSVESPDDSYIRDDESAKTFYLYKSLNNNEKDNLEDESLIVEKEKEVVDESNESFSSDNRTVNEESLVDTGDAGLVDSKTENNVNSVEPQIEVKQAIPIDSTRDLIAKNDLDKKKVIDRKAPTSIFENIMFKMLSLSAIIVLFFIIFLGRIRHRNLSHQK